mgnify:CR=1 FL=1
MITDLAVVTNVRAVHKEIIFSKPRTASTPLGPNIYRHVLSTDCPGSDFDARRFALKVSVLRRPSQTRVGMDSTVGAKPGSPNKRHVGADFGPRSELDLGTNEGECAYAHIFSQDRSLLDARRRVDLRGILEPRHGGRDRWRAGRGLGRHLRAERLSPSC